MFRQMTRSATGKGPAKGGEGAQTAQQPPSPCFGVPGELRPTFRTHRGTWPADERQGRYGGLGSPRGRRLSRGRRVRDRAGARRRSHLRREERVDLACVLCPPKPAAEAPAVAVGRAAITNAKAPDALSPPPVPNLVVAKVRYLPHSDIRASRVEPEGPSSTRLARWNSGMNEGGAGGNKLDRQTERGEPPERAVPGRSAQSSRAVGEEGDRLSGPRSPRQNHRRFST